MRIAIVLDNFSPHPSTTAGTRVGTGPRRQRGAGQRAVYGSWLNRMEGQFTALRYFALDGTDHLSHREQRA